MPPFMPPFDNLVFDDFSDEEESISSFDFHQERRAIRGRIRDSVGFPISYDIIEPEIEMRGQTPTIEKDNELPSVNVPLEIELHEPLIKSHEVRNSIVSFDLKVNEVYTVERYDEETVDDLWFSRTEFTAIKARDYLIVQLMDANSFQDSDDFSSRGLERRQSVKAITKAVLDEQRRQREKDEKDAECVANASRMHSGFARKLAQVIGQRDAEAAMPDRRSKRFSKQKRTEPTAFVKQLSTDTLDTLQDSTSTLLLGDTPDMSKVANICFSPIKAMKRMVSPMRRGSSGSGSKDVQLHAESPPCFDGLMKVQEKLPFPLADKQLGASLIAKCTRGKRDTARVIQ